MTTMFLRGQYRYFFYSNEYSEPLYIHIRAGKNEATFRIKPVELMFNYGFDSNELNEIENYLKQVENIFEDMQ